MGQHGREAAEDQAQNHRQQAADPSHIGNHGISPAIPRGRDRPGRS